MRLLGFLHGVLLTMVLTLRPRPSAPRLILAMLLASLTAYLGIRQFDAARGTAASALIIGLRYALPFLVGPFLHFYIAAATGRWLRLSRSSLLHLAPFLLTLSIAPCVSIAPENVTPFEFVHAIHGLGYTVSAARAVHGYASRVACLQAQKETRVRVLWLWSLVVCIGVTTLAAVCCHALGDPSFVSQFRIALVIHWIGTALFLFPTILDDSARHPRLSFRWRKASKPTVH